MSDDGRDWRIEIAEDVASVAPTVDANILGELLPRFPGATYGRFALVARDGDGDVAAGLVASTSYGWLLVAALWVRPDRRGAGLGTAMMAAAEREGRARGCHGAWLDTSSEAARRFYGRLGYAAFGALRNGPGRPPEGHARWFLSKDLA